MSIVNCLVFGDAIVEKNKLDMWVSIVSKGQLATDSYAIITLQASSSASSQLSLSGKIN